MRGREGEVRGGRREKRGREVGEEGVGGGRRGGGRRERGENREGGGRGKFCAREARAAPRREEGDKGLEGEVRGREGGDAFPPVRPLMYILHM